MGTEVGQKIVLVVEIHNPTRTPLWLRDFHYSLAPQGGTDSTRGRVALSETVAPGQTVTVPITVPVGAASGGGLAERFDLKGDLRGAAGDVAMSWRVGALASVGAPAAVVPQVDRVELDPVVAP